MSKCLSKVRFTKTSMAADSASGILPFPRERAPGKAHKACANSFLDASVAAIQTESASSRRCDGDQVAAVHERIFCVWICRWICLTRTQGSTA